MTTPNIERAIDLAQCAAKARATGQPNLAALYEKNALEAIREELARIRAERIKRNPNLIFKYFAEDAVRFVEAFQKALSNSASGQRKTDYALAGPSKGSGA